MAYTDHFENVQKLYIAYYQRPADPEGLVSWAKKIEDAGNDEVKFNAVLDAFASSKESKALYGGDIGLDNIGLAVRKMYQGLLGVDGDRAGRDFYIKKFNDGEYSAGQVAWKILDGAQDGTGTGATKDRTTISNKVTVANIFTEKVAGKKMSDPDFPTGKGPWNFAYDGDNAAKEARDYLAKVTEKSDSVQSENGVERFIIDSDYIAGKDAPGLKGEGFTYIVKPGADKFEGGNFDDYVYAPVDNMNSSLSSNADLKGGKGNNNKLRVEMAGSNGSALAPGAKIEAFQELEVVVKSLATTNNGVLSVNTNSTAKEVSKITIDGNTNNISINGSDKLETVIYDERGVNSSTIRGDKLKEVLIGEYTGKGNVNVYTKSDAVKIDAEFATVAGKYAVAGGVKDVTIEQNGVPQGVFISVDKDVESLKITGDVNNLKKLTDNNKWGVDLPTAGASLTTIDVSDLSLGLGDSSKKFSINDNFASDATKPINLLLGSGSNFIDVDRSIAAGSTIKFGDGNDYLLHSATGAINGNVEVIDGGAGVDKVSLKLINETNAKKFKNFEIVNVDDSGSGTYDITGMVFDSLELSNSLINNLNIKGLGNDTIFNIVKDSLIGDFNSKVVTLDNQNNLTLNYNKDAAAGTVTLNSRDTSNLFINNTSGNLSKVQINDFADLEEIFIKGNSDVTINDISTGPINHVKKIDASGFTGALGIDISQNKLSDRNLEKIIGGSGGDTIVLGANHDNVTLTGGGGDDTFDVSSNFAYSFSVTQAKGINTITDFSSGDKINVGAVFNAGLFGGAVVLPSTVTNLADALAHTSVNTGVANELKWFKLGNECYIVKNDGTLGFSATSNEIVIKLSGIADLQGKLIATTAGDITFAP